jgi:Heat induced stress protein YflT domain
MQTRGRFTQRVPGAASDGSRRTVASFGDYPSAERAVDYLSDHGFPVDHTAIVARDLRLVEQVTGRMGYLEAALRGLLSGAVAGILIGWLFAIFDWFDPAVARGWLIVDGFWFGALVGAIAGLIAHTLTRGRRDFASVRAVLADRYEVVADEEVADEAERLIRQISGAPA